MTKKRWTAASAIIIIASCSPVRAEHYSLGDAANIAFEAFMCLEYEERNTDPTQLEKLATVAYEEGRRFLTEARLKGIPSEEMSKMYIGITPALMPNRNDDMIDPKSWPHSDDVMLVRLRHEAARNVDWRFPERVPLPIPPKERAEAEVEFKNRCADIATLAEN